MSEPSLREPTFIGQVSAVRGGVVSVALRKASSTYILVEGNDYRVGQIGSFVRIPLGYTSLYGICIQVGASAERPTDETTVSISIDDLREPALSGFRWIDIALFGEHSDGTFERGVGQYPTVGDPVHLVTATDLDIIYQRDSSSKSSVSIGRVADSNGIRAALDVGAMVSRHVSIVGSTGSGKSNLVAVLLRALASGEFASSRVLVIDPHGEYGSAIPESTSVVSPDSSENGLRIPFWALPCDDFLEIAMGKIRDPDMDYLRNLVYEMKLESSARLTDPPPPQSVTADSPIPFSMKKLWWELENNERRTYSSPNDQTEETLYDATDSGDIETLLPPRYPPPSGKATPPHRGRVARGLGRQLELMRNRMLDSSFQFMFGDHDGYSPSVDGVIENDLDELIAGWVGQDLPITVLDVSQIPSTVLDVVVGTLLDMIYSALFWGMKLDVGGRKQPLLVVLDEAHRFLSSDGGGVATRACSRIAKEGRKYGVGLATVTQRPSDVDESVLSQAGTTISLRVTNRRDRAAVESSVSDDLGGLTDLLPSLRTGEALVLGEALQIPSRVRVDRAPERPVGDDPKMPDAWLSERPNPAEYSEVLRRWRAQSADATKLKPSFAESEPKPVAASKRGVSS